MVAAPGFPSKAKDSEYIIIDQVGIFSHGDEWGIGANRLEGFYSDNVLDNDNRELDLKPGAATFKDLYTAINYGTVHITPSTIVFLNACRASRGVLGADEKYYNWAQLLSTTTKCKIVGGVGNVGPWPDFSGWFMADYPTYFNDGKPPIPAPHYHNNILVTLAQWSSFGIRFPDSYFQIKGTWEVWNNGTEITHSLDEGINFPYIGDPVDNYGRNTARLFEW